MVSIGFCHLVLLRFWERKKLKQNRTKRFWERSARDQRSSEIGGGGGEEGKT